MYFTVRSLSPLPSLEIPRFILPLAIASHLAPVPSYHGTRHVPREAGVFFARVLGRSSWVARSCFLAVVVSVAPRWLHDARVQVG